MFSESTRSALTGRWTITRNPYLFVAPVTIVSVILIEAVTFLPKEIFDWFLASAIGYLSFCALLYCAHKTFFRQRDKSTTPIWWIFALGFIAGMLKGITTAVVSYFLELDLYLVQAIGSRMLTAGLLGLIGVPALAIVMNSLQDFKQQRALLIAEQVLVESKKLQSQEVVAAMGASIRTTIASDLDPLLDDLRFSLEVATGQAPSWQLIADNLRFAARESVRGISHKLWEKSNTKVPDLTLFDIGRAMVTTSAFPLRLILPILVLSAIPQTINDHGVSALWFRLTVLCASTALIYKFAEGLIKVLPQYQFLLYTCALIAAATAPSIHAVLALGDPLNAHVIGIAVVLAVWLPMLTVTCGLLDTALKQRNEIISDLMRQIDKGRVHSISEDNEIFRLSNEMAKYLHGNLQSRLMASALAIEIAGKSQDTSALIFEITKARKSIQTPFDQFATNELGPITIELQRLLSMWEGILGTELRFTGDDANVLPSEARNIIHIVEECFSNSLRHGMATATTIILAATETQILLTVIDNGLGPRDGSPGLGSSLFNSIAGSNWSLVRGPDGVGAQLNLQIFK